MRNYDGKSSGFYQGQFIVENKQKYIGTKAPIYRSGWERDLCAFFDKNKVCIKWVSEPDFLIIPYTLPDGTKHLYHPDFYCEMMGDNGKIKKFLIEVKPAAQSPKHSKPPKEPKIKNTKTMSQWQKKMQMYMVNKFKWDNTEAYLRKYHPDISFMVLTEIEAGFAETSKNRRNKI
jgi:hypothetical protein